MFGRLRVALRLHQRVAMELENLAIPIALRMRFEEAFEHLRGRVPLVGENVSQPQKIAKPFDLDCNWGSVDSPSLVTNSVRSGTAASYFCAPTMKLACFSSSAVETCSNPAAGVCSWASISDTSKNINTHPSTHAMPQAVAARLPTDDDNIPINRRFFTSRGRKRVS